MIDWVYPIKRRNGTIQKNVNLKTMKHKKRIYTSRKKKDYTLHIAQLTVAKVVLVR